MNEHRTPAQMDAAWHVGYVLKKENDPRRHKSKCRYHEKEGDYCRHMNSKCGGSAHCSWYSEEKTKQKKEEKELQTVQPRATNIKVKTKKKSNDGRIRKFTVKDGDTIVIIDETYKKGYTLCPSAAPAYRAAIGKVIRASYQVVVDGETTSYRIMDIIKKK